LSSQKYLGCLASLPLASFLDKGIFVPTIWTFSYVLSLIGPEIPRPPFS
jgi:hypothetical protein